MSQNRESQGKTMKLGCVQQQDSYIRKHNTTGEKHEKNGPSLSRQNLKQIPQNFIKVCNVGNIKANDDNAVNVHIF